jgi:hypothetical protein
VTNIPIDEEERHAMLKTLIWGELKCPSGHPIPKVLENQR